MDEERRGVAGEKTNVFLRATTEGLRVDDEEGLVDVRFADSHANVVSVARTAGAALARSSLLVGPISTFFCHFFSGFLSLNILFCSYFLSSWRLLDARCR